MSRRGTRALALVVLVSLLGGSAGCGTTSNHTRPRVLAFVGAGIALGGSAVWLTGENRDKPGNLPAIGLGTVAVGVVAMIAAGAWMAAEVTCQADPDCPEYEECREIPAPPGGVPYKQCVPR
ncbi:MAG TPA: hypothetical protein VGP07_01980 [Polyangia bacterium]|jgi:hypothetical protein